MSGKASLPTRALTALRDHGLLTITANERVVETRHVWEVPVETAWEVVSDFPFFMQIMLTGVVPFSHPRWKKGHSPEDKPYTSMTVLSPTGEPETFSGPINHDKFTFGSDTYIMEEMLTKCEKEGDTYKVEWRAWNQYLFGTTPWDPETPDLSTFYPGFDQSYHCHFHLRDGGEKFPGQTVVCWKRFYNEPQLLGGLLPMSNAMAARFEYGNNNINGVIMPNFFRHYVKGLRNYPGIPGPPDRGLPTKNGKILIVGAGPSGLHMAHLLVTRVGIDPKNITFLERTDRYGGKTVSVPGVTATEVVTDVVHELGTCYLAPAYYAVRGLFDELVPQFNRFASLDDDSFEAMMDKVRDLPDYNRMSPTEKFDHFWEIEPLVYDVTRMGKSSLGIEGWVQDQAQGAVDESLFQPFRIIELLVPASYQVGVLAAKQKYNILHRKMLGEYFYSMPPKPSEEYMEELLMPFGDWLKKHGLLAMAPFLAYGNTCQGYGTIEATETFWAMCWITPALLDGYFDTSVIPLPRAMKQRVDEALAKLDEKLEAYSDALESGEDSADALADAKLASSELEFVRQHALTLSPAKKTMLKHGWIKLWQTIVETHKLEGQIKYNIEVQSVTRSTEEEIEEGKKPIYVTYYDTNAKTAVDAVVRDEEYDYLIVAAPLYYGKLDTEQELEKFNGDLIGKFNNLILPPIDQDEDGENPSTFHELLPLLKSKTELGSVWKEMADGDKPVTLANAEEFFKNKDWTAGLTDTYKSTTKQIVHDMTVSATTRGTFTQLDLHILVRNMYLCGGLALILKELSIGIAGTITEDSFKKLMQTKFGLEPVPAGARYQLFESQFPEPHKAMDFQLLCAYLGELIIPLHPEVPRWTQFLSDKEKMLFQNRQFTTHNQFGTTLFEVETPRPHIKAHLNLNSELVYGNMAGTGEIFASRDSYLAINPRYTNETMHEFDPMRFHKREMMAYQYVDGASGTEFGVSDFLAKFNSWAHDYLGPFRYVLPPADSVEKTEHRQTDSFQKFWTYFLHPNAEGLKKGHPWEILEVQGQNNTMIAHASTFFESVLDIVNYNNMMVGGLQGEHTITIGTGAPCNDAKAVRYMANELHYDLFQNTGILGVVGLSGHFWRMFWFTLALVLNTIWTIFYFGLAPVFTWPYLRFQRYTLLRQFKTRDLDTELGVFSQWPLTYLAWTQYDMETFLVKTPSIRPLETTPLPSGRLRNGNMPEMGPEDDEVLELLRDESGDRQSFFAMHPEIPEPPVSLAQLSPEDYRVAIREWFVRIDTDFLGFLGYRAFILFSFISSRLPVLWNFCASYVAMIAFGQLTGFSVRIEDEQGGGAYVPRCEMLAEGRRLYGQENGNVICSTVCKVLTEEFMKTKGADMEFNPDLAAGSCLIRARKASSPAFRDHVRGTDWKWPVSPADIDW